MSQTDSASHIFEGQILMWQNMRKNRGESFGDSSELIVSRSYGNGSYITSLVMQFKNLWPAINVTASMSIRREVRSPFKECAKKRGPYKKERLSHILATNVFGLTKVSDTLNFKDVFCIYSVHGLRTPNEGINLRNLKIWADVADQNMLRPYLKIWELELISAVQ